MLKILRRHLISFGLYSTGYRLIEPLSWIFGLLFLDSFMFLIAPSCRCLLATFLLVWQPGCGRGCLCSSTICWSCSVDNLMVIGGSKVTLSRSTPSWAVVAPRFRVEGLVKYLMPPSSCSEFLVKQILRIWSTPNFLFLILLWNQKASQDVLLMRQVEINHEVFFYHKELQCKTVLPLRGHLIYIRCNIFFKLHFSPKKININLYFVVKLYCKKIYREGVRARDRDRQTQRERQKDRQRQT